jgi:hypothetical protein
MGSPSLSSGSGVTANYSVKNSFHLIYALCLLLEFCLAFPDGFGTIFGRGATGFLVLNSVVPKSSPKPLVTPRLGCSLERPRGWR